MNYDDFPILNDEGYEILKKNYSTPSKPNRRDLVFKICQTLSNLVCSCFEFEDVYNKKIITSIEQTKEILLKHMDNFTELFNIKLEGNKKVKAFNVFSFLKDLTKLPILFNKWSDIEEKEYYKITAQKSMAEIFNCIEEILSVLQTSNIKFYKYM